MKKAGKKTVSTTGKSTKKSSSVESQDHTDIDDVDYQLSSPCKRSRPNSKKTVVKSDSKKTNQRLYHVVDDEDEDEDDDDLDSDDNEEGSEEDVEPSKQEEKGKKDKDVVPTEIDIEMYELVKEKELNDRQKVKVSQLSVDVEVDVNVVEQQLTVESILKYFDSLSLPEDLLIKLRHLVKRPLIEGRKYPPTWYNRDELVFFRHILESQGWLEIVGTTNYIYVPELLQFYATVVLPSDASYLEAQVNGKLIRITVDDFYHVFGVPSHGSHHCLRRSWPISMSDSEKLEVTRFFHSTASKRGSVSYKVLSAEHRLVHNLFRKTLMPRIGARNVCYIPDMLLMYNLFHHKPVCLPKLVFKHIAISASKAGVPNPAKQQGLPYGIWISKLLQFKQVVKSGTIALPPIDQMKKGSLGRMFLDIVDHKLVSKLVSKPLVKEKGEASNNNNNNDRGDVKAELEVMNQKLDLVIKQQGEATAMITALVWECKAKDKVIKDLLHKVDLLVANLL